MQYLLQNKQKPTRSWRSDGMNL